MNSSEQRLKVAFDAITLPPSLKVDTLTLLAQKRRELNQISTEQGSQTQTRSRSARRFSRAALALAACLVLAVLGLAGFGAYTTNTAYVDIELNPSITLGLNRFDVVIGVWANNADGQAVLDTTALRGRSYRQALVLLTENATFQSFLDEDSFLVISLASDDERQLVKLLSFSQSLSENLPCECWLNQLDQEERHAADAADMGIARYQVAQILIALDETMTIEDCQQMSMRELREAISALDPENAYAWHGAGNHGAAGHGATNQNLNQNQFGRRHRSQA